MRPPGSSRAAPGDDRAALEEVLSRTDLVDIVSRHVGLKRAGHRLVGLCPFHQEKTPSFSVDPDKQLWHCFGCKAGGDVFTFVMRTEGVDFAEALRMLAERAGVSLRASPRERAIRAQRVSLAELNARAAKFFRQALQGDEGQAARDFLAARGVSAEMVERFQLGYAPEAGAALVQHLVRGGAAVNDIVNAGLALPGGAVGPAGEGLRDRFRGRLIFPIPDMEERVVAFGARILPAPDSQGAHGKAGGGEEQETDRLAAAKYINSSETPLFKKGRTLYGLPLARTAMAKTGRAVVVEGYLDVIACHQGGLTETVATLGTALTADHIGILRRFADTVCVALDPDPAGITALLRSLPMFREQEVQVRVVALPPGQDPDEVLRSEGPERLRALVDAAVSPVEFQLRQIAERLGGWGKAPPEAFIREVVPILAALPDEVEIGFWVRKVAQAWTAAGMRADRTEEELRQHLRRFRQRRQERQAQPAAVRSGTSAPPAASQSRTGGTGLTAEEYVLAAILSDPELAAAVAAVRVLPPEVFAEPVQRTAFRRLVDAAVEGAGDFSHGDTPEETALLARLAAASLPRPTAEQLERAVRQVERRAQQRRAASLVERLRRGEALSDAELTELQRLGQEGSAQAAKPIRGE